MQAGNREMADLCMEDGQFCNRQAEAQPSLTEQKLYSNSMSARVPKRQGAASPLSDQAPRSSRRAKSPNREWNWLASKFEEMRPEKHFNPRKGVLPEELIRAIWRDDSDPTTAKVPIESLKKWALEIANLTAARKKREQRKDKVPTTIMDVLLQNWTYFHHSHADVNNVHKHVHAKYCEGEFGHFQLLNGKQVHVCYNVPVRSLVRELKGLLNRLRSQILQKGYQEIPTLKPPVQEEVPEFETPPMPPMPQLYPIDGLIPIPSEEDENIPPDLPLPVFKAPIPTEYPSLNLPQPLKAPALMLPVMKDCEEDESTIDYELYKEEKLPNLVLPDQEPLPLWEEPLLTGMPKLPVPVEAEPLTPPILEKIHPYQTPVLEARPCQRAYYVPDDGKAEICEGLCCKHHHSKDTSAMNPRGPCQAQPPQFPTPPPPPFAFPLQLIPEPILELPPEEQPLPFEPPSLMDEPVYGPPPEPDLPPWKTPPPPPYIGWLGGQRPVFLIDCSGTMAGARMKYVYNCMKTLFSPGGQVEVAATHFDIISYSFDAWSFGTIENNRKYGTAMCTVKYMEGSQCN